MNLTEVVKPITYLKNNTAEVVRQASESGPLLVVTQNGEAKAAVKRYRTPFGDFALAEHC